MKLITALLCLAALHANAEPITPTAHRDTVQIKVVWLPTNAAVQRTCSELGAWGGVNPHVHFYVGCNAYNHETNVCTIYTVEPTDLDDEKTRVLGHEALHCFEGVYHGQDKL